ncbi:MAG: trimethylamine methyltransferase family protein [Anaerolineae bacterium]|jgi:trimethylamine--corrinoid protein Co-methyltransferase|nr:trimethylamine methyltransferase family protein [Anaerolineae bacterium]MDH7473342.1 trimethylamine methyltransferase family protein [Anaerolineae bacterium]
MLNPWAVLTQHDIESIHHTSLAILRDVGVSLPNQEVLEALAGAGADVDFNHQVARIPERLVVDSVERAGKQYILYGRDPNRTARFGYGDFVLVSSPGQFAWVDEDGGPRRQPTQEDARAGILVSDALEHIDIVGAMGMPLDIPAEYRDVWMAAELVKNSTKPTHVWVANGRSLEYILRIYEAVSGGRQAHRQRPMIAAFIEPISPLRFPETGLEILITCARYGLPIAFGPMVQAGATGPATLAGTLALENAEILAGIVLAQLFGPGVPVCYGGIPHIMDMRSSQISFGAPEQGLMAVAMTQIARYYGLPVYINVGLSDSKRVDIQSGLERGMTLLMGALAGADTFGHMGILGADQAASLEQLIVDNEMAAYIKRILRGFEVNEDTLALDVIRKVGIGGNFLGEAHTRQHFRQELWFPTTFDRRRWDEWWAAGARSMADWAHERKTQILAEHRPPSLTLELTRELDDIVAAARRER